MRGNFAPSGWASRISVLPGSRIRGPGVSIGTGSQPAPAITTTSKWRVSSGRQVCVRFAARHLRQPAFGLLENCRAAAIAAPRRGGSSPRRVHRNFQIASASSMASLSINRSSDVEGFQPAARAVLARRHLVPPGSRLRHRDSPASTVLDDALLRVGKDGLCRRAWRRRRCPVTTARRWNRDRNSFRGARTLQRLGIEVASSRICDLKARKLLI